MNRLEKLRELEQKATPPPKVWVYEPASPEDNDVWAEGDPEVFVAEAGNATLAALIAHSRTDLPLLLGLAEAVRREMECDSDNPLEDGITRMRRVEAALAPLLEEVSE